MISEIFVARPLIAGLLASAALLFAAGFIAHGVGRMVGEGREAMTEQFDRGFTAGQKAQALAEQTARLKEALDAAARDREREREVAARIAAAGEDAEKARADLEKARRDYAIQNPDFAACEAMDFPDHLRAHHPRADRLRDGAEDAAGAGDNNPRGREAAAAISARGV